jgi:hypothetical protein
MLFSYKPTKVIRTHTNINSTNIQLKINYSYPNQIQGNRVENVQDTYPVINNSNNQPKIKFRNNTIKIFDGIKHTNELIRMKNPCFTCG